MSEWILGIVGTLIALGIGGLVTNLFRRLYNRVDNHDARIQNIEENYVDKDHFDHRMDNLVKSINEQHSSLSRQVSKLDDRIYRLATKEEEKE